MSGFIQQLQERALLRQKHTHHTANLQALKGLGFPPNHRLVQQHMEGLEEVEQRLAPMPRTYDPRGI